MGEYEKKRNVKYKPCYLNNQKIPFKIGNGDRKAINFKRKY